MSFNRMPNGEVHSTAEDFFFSSRSSLQAQYISSPTACNGSHLIARPSYPPASQQVFQWQGGTATGYTGYTPLQFAPPARFQDPVPPTRRYPRTSPRPQKCQKCKRLFPRRQERDRHLRSYFPHWIYCPSLRCPWTGDRPDMFKKHWKDKHGDEGPIPLRERFEIYSPDQVVEFIILGVISVDEAAAHARSLVDARMWELGKPDVWEDLQGRRVRRARR